MRGFCRSKKRWNCIACSRMPNSPSSPAVTICFCGPSPNYLLKLCSIFYYVTALQIKFCEDPAVSAEHHAAIDQWVNTHQHEIIPLVEQLIRFPSVNRAPEGDEAEAQAFVAATMRAMQLEVDVFLPTDVPALATHPALWHGRD